jgi:ApaG protein
VRGEGVVGEQPVLMPGAVFEYSSGAVLETPLGKMEGSYQMIGEDGLPFEASIETFRLAVPNVLN